MNKIILLVAAALLAFGAEDAWLKVGKLKGGTELRIFKKGIKQPVLAKMDEANDERVVVVIKNEQVAIPKEDIDQIDYRPQGGSKMTKETRTTTRDEVPTPGNPHATPGPATSTSSNVTFGSKPDFETLYRRATAPPRK